MPAATLPPRRASPAAPASGQAPLTVVGIGASAGGLDACTKPVRGLPDGNGMAFILVQHLHPSHDSLLVELLAAHTAMPVAEAADGMPLEPDHLYVIPPGTYLSVEAGALHLSEPTAPRGMRLPFDYLLNSLAGQYGKRAICVVLSGTGADGSLGLVAIKAHGGLVIAQDPHEAEYDGMPQSAIATGAVDLVLAAADMPDALATHPHPLGTSTPNGEDAPGQASFAAVVELLRLTTPHDFTLYKPGTLQRRIERRMSMAGAADLAQYLDRLRTDPAETGRLANDLLINVTRFFRDPQVFDRLAADIIPGLIRGHDESEPLRVWVAGCSTGEETWSLAMMFREQLTALESPIRLQIFASDADAEAVASARVGRYPKTIAAQVSPARLARFFADDEHGYRVLPELRSLVVFTVQDVLADPPFSRLDFISCRNLLIYLRRDAQVRVLSLFDFALNEGGVLLLGAAETLGNSDGRFEAIAKSERLYRRVGRGRPAGVQFPVGATGRAAVPPSPPRATSPQTTIAAFGQRLVLDAYAPAAILINSRNECLYALGPVDRYLQVASGTASQDVLTLARDSVRAKLRTALHMASQDPHSIVRHPAPHPGAPASFSIEIRPVEGPGEATRLICFVEHAGRAGVGEAARPVDEPRVAELENELAAMRAELAEAARSSDASSEEQRALNEEALSVNEEYHSTNEELLTSKEELQSLNEELTALNSQLQETLERQRTTSNDMQNVLYSTDVATLFLDRQLNIRFFTPKTRSLFNVIPGDVGRPLTDLVSLAADAALPGDARAVLEDLVPVEREIEANGAWFTRRILPYRTDDKGVEGVVITFTDVTERKNTGRALEVAKHEAERANAAKSRFLAAASHDLRQPLQTLALLQGLLAKAVEGKAAEALVTRMDVTLDAMSGMLNTVLDINQIEAGVIRTDVTEFPIAAVLDGLRDEYGYQAQAQGLKWRVMPCSLTVRSDKRLLERMLRNLVSNALKYTKRGTVLLGCRRRGASLAIEVWDTGAGIPADKLDAIFEEYTQLDNGARDRSKGLGLGLSIVQRLGDLLGHTITVRSRQGRGSVFAIKVALVQGRATPAPGAPLAIGAAAADLPRTGAILVVEDDAALRDLLQLFLRGEGHSVAIADDGAVALERVNAGAFSPDLLLADYNLTGRLNGLQLAARLRRDRRAPLPVIILTGDVSAGSLREIAQHDCVPLNKPVKLETLTGVLQRLLPPTPAGDGAAHRAQPRHQTIFVIDDDANIRAGLRDVLEAEGWQVEVHASSEAFSAAYRPDRDGCLLIDAYLPGIGGLDLLRRLRGLDDRIPAIIITGQSDVQMAVEAMKAGASDFINKPVGRAELLTCLERAFEQSSDSGKLSSWRTRAARAVRGLTARQRQIMALVIAGHPSKNIAKDLGISQRTVENHRAAIMERTGSTSLPALARLALAAAWTGSDQSLVAAGPTALTARA